MVRRFDRLDIEVNKERPPAFSQRGRSLSLDQNSLPKFGTVAVVDQPWLTVLLLCLATYRITRFVTKDSFPLIAKPREWIQMKWDPFDEQNWDNWYARTKAERIEVAAQLKARKNIPYPNIVRKSIAYLITCPWCVSIYVGAGVAWFFVWALGGTWPYALLIWLTSSAVTGILAQRETD